MTNVLSDMPIAELERVLNIRKRDILALAKKRDKLKAELDEVERQLAEISGDSGTIKGHNRARYLTRPKNEKSLRLTVFDVLKEHPKGLKISEIAQKVLDSGYKTNSANFNNVLYQCLYGTKEIQHNVETQLYRFAPKGGRSKKSK